MPKAKRRAGAPFTWALLNTSKRVLLPMSNAPNEIRSLDGLRAVAALSVLVYHAVRAITQHVTVFGLDVTFAWYYTQTGVHLFFVLSGFLLFMPFARALLLGTVPPPSSRGHMPKAKGPASVPARLRGERAFLPSVRQFYRRRALRILPAYYVCLAILVLLALPSYLNGAGLANIGAHLVLLHDDFADLSRDVFLATPATMSATLIANHVPDFNRTIEGPFWTLAVEAQFYVLLPWMAWGIARVVGATHSVGRLIGGVLLVMAAALAIRELDSAIFAHLQVVSQGPSPLLSLFLRVTLGWQGKFLEVFAIGMLCAVLYVAVSEGRLSPAIATRRTAAGLLAAALVLWFVLGHVALQYHIEVPPYFNLMDPTDLKQIFGPFLVGIGYGALLLAVLWGGRRIRAVFEWAPLVFVGLISYSLYLWHEPIIVNLLGPHVRTLPAGIQVGVSLVVGLAVALPVAYLSYQLVERPFLKRRRRAAAPAPMSSPSGSLAQPQPTADTLPTTSVPISPVE